MEIIINWELNLHNISTEYLFLPTIIDNCTATELVSTHALFFAKCGHNFLQIVVESVENFDIISFNNNEITKEISLFSLAALLLWTCCRILILPIKLFLCFSDVFFLKNYETSSPIKKNSTQISARWTDSNILTT